jgi:hypothetical protein
MNIKQAKKLVAYDQKWRRGGDGDMPDPKQLGIAIDVLLAEPEKRYGDIATELQEAAINWPSFMSDQTSQAAWIFIHGIENKETMQYAKENTEFNIHWRTFLLFVAEAITW